QQTWKDRKEGRRSDECLCALTARKLSRRCWKSFKISGTTTRKQLRVSVWMKRRKGRAFWQSCSQVNKASVPSLMCFELFQRKCNCHWRRADLIQITGKIRYIS